MSQYQSLSDLKLRLSKQYKPKKFYPDASDPDSEFDDLLTQLEKESRGIIESYKDDVSFEQQSYTKTKQAPDNARISGLVYPIDSVASVEYRQHQEDSWETLDKRKWRFSDHAIILRKVPKRRRRNRVSRTFNRRNRLLDNARRATWNDWGSELRIEYTAGFDPIPQDVIHIQIRLISNMLTQLRKDQTQLPSSPQNMMDDVREEKIFTDDIKELLDHITRTHGMAGVI